VRWREHPKNFRQKRSQIRALIQSDRRIVAGEEHGSNSRGLGGQVKHPKIAEPICCNRQPIWEHLRVFKRHISPREVNAFEAPVDSGAERKEIAQVLRQRLADFRLQRNDVVWSQRRRQLKPDSLAVFVHEDGLLGCLDMVDGGQPDEG
jgi:hypothetical protein